MNITIDKPLVTLGLPSFNRAEGIKRSIENAINQTYKNLEIIVSDNYSDNREYIKSIVESYMQNDNRIKFYTQQQNIGAFNNFKFLLEKASGDYFMWMADDDERHEKCVETFLQIIGNTGGTYGTYDVKNRYYNTIFTQQVPPILSKMPLHKTLHTFIRTFPSVFIYGLYKRKDLDFFLNEKEAFDFMDGYFVMHVLIKNGLNIRPTEYSLTTVGINDEKYIPKPYKKSADKLFVYKPVVKKCFNLIWESKQLNIFYKIYLLSFFLLQIAKRYITHEHPYRFFAKVLNVLIRLPLRYIHRLKRVKQVS